MEISFLFCKKVSKFEKVKEVCVECQNVLFHNGRFPMALTEQLKLFVRCNNIFIRSIVIISNYVI